MNSRGIIGILSIFVGIFLILMGFASFKFRQVFGDDKILYVAMTTILSGMAGIFLIRLGNRLMALSDEEIKRNIKCHSPVLYLRSFVDDTIASKRKLNIPFFFPTNISGEEEQLADSLHKFGTVVAVGIPGEILPKQGAARLYFDDQDWRLEVSKLIKKSRVIVLRAGFTKHFWWEVESVLLENRPDKFLLLLPRKFDDIRRFIKELEEKFDRKIAMPNESFFERRIGGFGTIPRRCSVGGILWFDREWNPKFDSMQYPLFVGIARKPISVLFENSMKNFFRYYKYGKEAKNSASIPRRVIAFIIDLFTFYLAFATAALIEKGNINILEISDGSILIVTFLLLVYLFSMEISPMLGTFGKSIYGIEVRDIGGGKPSIGQIYLRNVLKIIQILPTGIVLISVLLIFFRKSSIHDFLSSTRILNRT